MSDKDRLDQISQLLEKPKTLQRDFEPTIPFNYDRGIKPILDAIELLAAEVRDIRDRL